MTNRNNIDDINEILDKIQILNSKLGLIAHLDESTSVHDIKAITIESSEQLLDIYEQVSSLAFTN